MKNSGLFIGVFIFYFLIVGCEHIVAPQLPKGEVLVQSTAPNLYITNMTDVPLNYFVVGRETAAAISWAAISDINTSIAKGATVRLPYKDIYRAEHEKEVLVYWWHAFTPSIRISPDKVQGTVVKL